MAYLSEFDQSGLTPDALAAWQQFESAAGRGFRINSAFRDPSHNAAVGGAKNSQHTHGKAFDVDVADLSEAERIELIRLARASGFGGVGVYDNSLHFDVGATRYWGPDYHAGSLPSWAADAVGAERGALPPGHSQGDGHGSHQPNMPDANAMAQMQPRGNALPVAPQFNALDPAAFQRQIPQNALYGFTPGTSPFIQG